MSYRYKNKFGDRTFCAKCSECSTKNKVPISGGPEQIDCYRCKKTMLTRLKCHCGVTAYLKNKDECCP